MLTEEQKRIIEERYPDTVTKDLAEELGVSCYQIFRYANERQIKKTVEFYKRINKRPNAGHFKPGIVPYNKGKKITEYCSPEVIERMRATQFKKGNLPHNTRQMYDERIDKDGYIEIKVSYNKFKPKHRWLWEQKFGPIPKGFNIIFADGDKRNFELSNLEIISNGDLMKKNSYHRLPEEIRDLIHTKAQLTRQINKKENDKKPRDKGQEDEVDS